MKPRTYEGSGVSIERGDAFASYLAGLTSSAIGELGGFAGGVDLDLSGYRHPVLLTSTDGVGTKLLVAKQVNDYTTVGIDLVAMCVNDLAVCGARPLVFLDYIACGRLQEPVLEAVVAGIVRGCEQADCTLAGGETAELPDMYGEDEIDLAGFTAGVVERDDRLPQPQRIVPGDVVVGLASSGVHSNGLTLARKIVPESEAALWRELLTPTRIYVRELLAARPYMKAAAHITGGGLAGNLERVLPQGLRVELRWDWSYPSIFDAMRRLGDVEVEEMRRVYNMGVGVAMITGRDELEALAGAVGEPVLELGRVADG